MSKLEPCPFCGGEATRLCFSTEDSDWLVKCAEKNKCYMRPRTRKYGTATEATAAWNKRAKE